jgi:hypothetical protein
MKGQVFAVAKLHYLNGVVHEVAERGTTDLQTLAKLSAQTTKKKCLTTLCMPVWFGIGLLLSSTGQ